MPPLVRICQDMLEWPMLRRFLKQQTIANRRPRFDCPLWVDFGSTSPARHASCQFSQFTQNGKLGGRVILHKDVACFFLGLTRLTIHSGHLQDPASHWSVFLGWNRISHQEALAGGPKLLGPFVGQIIGRSGMSHY